MEILCPQTMPPSVPPLKKDQELSWAVRFMKGKSLLALLLRLTWNAYFYFVWKERNCRIFQSVSRYFSSIVLDSKGVVQLRLHGRFTKFRMDSINFLLYYRWDTKRRRRGEEKRVFCLQCFATLNYLRVELGDFMAFVDTGNILLEYIIGGAVVARSWTSYFATLCNHDPEDFLIIVNSIPKDYGKLDPIAVVIGCVIGTLVVLGTKGSSRFNYFMKADTKNYKDFAPFGVRGVFKSSVVTSPLIDKDVPFSVAFEAVGMSWAKYVVAAGALIGLTTVLLVGAIGQARYLMHIARTHMMPPWLAQVIPKTGTPINATIVMLTATVIIGFFMDLEILANLLSISTLFIFLLGPLPQQLFIGGMYNNNNFIIYSITVSIWLLATAGIVVFVPHARKPKAWGVPMVPWLPSLSIAINIFLLGSIDRASFKRFGIWTGVLLLYYFFFGLHASYDTAKASGENKTRQGQKKIVGHKKTSSAIDIDSDQVRSDQVSVPVISRFHAAASRSMSSK
ncbi:hypothetical protein GQ457_17G001320 [Hibiscus cannabinus]